MRCVRVWLIVLSLFACDARNMERPAPRAVDPASQPAARAPDPKSPAAQAADPTPQPAPRAPAPALAVDLIAASLSVHSPISRFVGANNDPASPGQKEVAAGFTPGVSDCVVKHDVKGKLKMMLAVSPDRAETPLTGWAMQEHDFPKGFTACLSSVYARGRMPEGERFNGLLMLEYRVK